MSSHGKDELKRRLYGQMKAASNAELQQAIKSESSFSAWIVKAIPIITAAISIIKELWVIFQKVLKR